MQIPADLREHPRLFFELLAPDGGLVELRPFMPSRSGRARPDTGLYDDGDRFAADALRSSDSGAEAVYATVNPPMPSLLALLGHKANRLRRAEHGGTTNDEQIVRRRFLVLDLDPVRPTRTSATDSEKPAAIARARDLYRYTEGRGWPPPFVVDSGNGAHLWYNVDLPVDDGRLVHRVLQALDARFSDGAVHVDTAVGNASRILKVPGTMARKGRDTTDRPHRLARFLSVRTISAGASGWS